MLVENSDFIIEPEPLSIEAHTFDKPSSDQRKPLHPIVFCLNLLMMMSIPTFVCFEVFYEAKELRLKAYVAIVIISWCTAVMILTILNLKITLLEAFKTFIILDSLLVSFAVGALVFVGLMYFMDRGKWEFKVLQLAFCIGAFSNILNIRLLLLFMKWKRIQVISFKIGLFLMALTYFCAGVYCTYTNKSFTYNLSKYMDQRIQYFLVLFTFAAFDFMSNMIKVFSNFDYSEEFRHDYVIRSVNHGNLRERQDAVISYIRKMSLQAKKPKRTSMASAASLKSRESRQTKEMLKEMQKKEQDEIHMIPVTRKAPIMKTEMPSPIFQRQGTSRMETEATFGKNAL